MAALWSLCAESDKARDEDPEEYEYAVSAGTEPPASALGPRCRRRFWGRNRRPQSWRMARRPRPRPSPSRLASSSSCSTRSRRCGRKTAHCG
eukprot:5270504-Prymnesium_polylepis.1